MHCQPIASIYFLMIPKTVALCSHTSTRNHQARQNPSDAITGGGFSRATSETRTPDLSFTKARGDSASDDAASSCDDPDRDDSSRRSSSSAKAEENGSTTRLLKAWNRLDPVAQEHFLGLFEAMANGAAFFKGDGGCD